jgi:hypothetical protein
MLFPSMVSCDSSRLEGICFPIESRLPHKPCTPPPLLFHRLKLYVGLAMLNARFCAGLRNGVVRVRLGIERMMQSFQP